MELLPEEIERAQLLEQLADLLRAEGGHTFLTGPLIEPNEKWFPDRWTPDAAGVERLIRRLLGHADLGALTLTLEIDRFSDAHGEVLSDGRAGGHSGTAAWFAGIRDGVCSFGVDINQLRDPEGLVGTLAHEVAHAYRTMYEHRVPDHALEERLTDLTTVFLGFGVLTVNASQRFRSGSSGAGASWYSRAEGGYLSMQSMSYLLAAQVVARGEPAGDVGRLLTPNQRACFKAAYKELGARDALLGRLGLPPAASVPASSDKKGRGWFRRWFTS
ncbi:MAG TPA: hypothetical protein VGF94_02790 [Kofleriaceae bacterium]